jgi:hypothetical protein
MIDDKQKIEVAKNFARFHPSAFAMWLQGREHDLEGYYLTVFDDLIAGVYGECYGVNAEFDGDGFQIQEATKYEVNVDRYDLNDSHAEIFCFEITLGQVDGGRIIEEYETDGI